MLKYKLKEQNEEDTQDDQSWGNPWRRTRDTYKIMGDKSSKKKQTKVSSDYEAEDIKK